MDTLNNIREHILDINQKVVAGDIDALGAYIQLHSLSEVLKDAMAGVKAEAMADAQRRKGEVYQGKLIGFTEGRRTFDYSGIPDIVNVEKGLEVLKERHKNAALQLEKGMKAVDDETGEWIQPAIVKYGEPVITLKTPKQ